MNLYSLWAAATGGLVFLAATSSSFAAPPSPEAFGRLPSLQDAAISPDGQSIAIIGGPADHRRLVITTIDKPDAPTLELGPVHASWVRWAGDGFVVVQVTRYEQPYWAKYSYNMTRNLSIDRSGKFRAVLLSNSPESAIMTEQPLLKLTTGDKPAAYVLGRDMNVHMAQDDNTRFAQNHDYTRQALWKVDVATGKGVVADKSTGMSWAFDMDGDIRAKIDSGVGGLVLAARGKSQSAFRNLVAVKDRAITLLGYSDAQDAVYWTQEDGEHGAARLYQAVFPQGVPTLVQGAPENAGMRFDPYTNQPLSIDVYDHPGAWIDPKLAATQTALAKVFKGKSISIGNWSRDRSRFVVRVVSPSEPAAWYLYDPGRGEVSALGDEYPELKGAPLGTKTFTSYKAADGMTIPAYVHMPPGGRTTGLPLIVLPHGGPAARDDDEFDWWAQFLASRGYVVLQPQFRGSDGFGYELRHAGYREWAGKMQTDLIDGVNWLAGQGTIDPKQVCIMGASYGGYAALEAMTAHPDTYRCGVSVNGISDLGQLVNQTGKLFDNVDKSEMLQEFGSNHWNIAAASPGQHTDKVNGPILLIYSANDTTVPPAQTTNMADQLKHDHKPATVVLLPGDDHHLRNSASRVQMLTAIDQFLTTNLPVKP